ncbi:unnamed protein product [Blepharisma stoltei]|uniref:Uncharacterized protein n=1 Tax=Blepharisma stoltei TaxID=1481888 RepID=A0AAU9IEH0_9CILI|nr:unnamed protein product [Blepharisma stoltei]
MSKKARYQFQGLDSQKVKDALLRSASTPEAINAINSNFDGQRSLDEILPQIENFMSIADALAEVQRDSQGEEGPRKRQKKSEPQPEDLELLSGGNIFSGINVIRLEEELPRAFDTKAPQRKIGSQEITKITVLEKNALQAINDICMRKNLEAKPNVLEVVELGMQEFLSRILDKLNNLQANAPENVKYTVDPREVIGEKEQILHNKAKKGGGIMTIRENDIISVLGINKWKLKNWKGE